MLIKRNNREFVEKNTWMSFNAFSVVYNNEVSMLKFRTSMMFFFSTCFLSAVCYAGPGKRAAQTDSQTTPAVPPAMQPPAQQPMVDCSQLTADQQQFAYGLIPENRALFCGKFSDVQRAAAMQLTSQPDPTGALLSPDQAVARVAAANNMTPAKKSSGGCPVK